MHGPISERLQLMTSSFRAALAALATLALAPAAFAQAKAPAKSQRIRYVVAPTGNEARYRVREQLAGFDLPNAAVGVTKDVTGLVVVEPDGKIVKDSSRGGGRRAGRGGGGGRRGGGRGGRARET